MNKINLSIIIISYNVKEKIIKCIENIKNITNTEFIIIDNNSKDNTYFELINKYSKNNNFKINKNNKNIGFSKAVNQGINLSKGKKILLLNPDTTPNIKSIYILEKFIDENFKIGLVGGKMTKPNTDKIHGTYVNKPNFFTSIFEFTNIKKILPNNIFHKKFYYLNENLPHQPKQVVGLSGGFLMFNKSLIENIGYLDENFFMYLEDIDLGIRSTEYGYKNYYIPQSSIIHDSGSSSRNKYKINIAAWNHSKRYFFKKYLPYYQYLFINLLFNLDDFLNKIIHLISINATRFHSRTISK